MPVVADVGMNTRSPPVLVASVPSMLVIGETLFGPMAIPVPTLMLSPLSGVM